MSEDAIEHLRLWLRVGMTGCAFAKHLANKANRVAIEAHVDAELPPVAWLNNALDAHAKADRVVVAMFPQITNEVAFVDLVNLLGTDARWHVRRRAKLSPSGGVLVALEWETSDGDLSETMGFAPFPSMPVPRRAPYVAIATWPGARLNPFRGQGSTPPGRAGEVSFLDASHDFEEPEYERLYASTTASVKALMAVPPDDAGLYRRTSFVLPPDHAAKLTFES